MVKLNIGKFFTCYCIQGEYGNSTNQWSIGFKNFGNGLVHHLFIASASCQLHNFFDLIKE